MIKILLSRALGILLALLAVASIMKAQSPPCPDDVPPLAGGSIPGWTHIGAPIPFTGAGGCTGTVDYCYRTLFPYPATGQTTYQTVVIAMTTDGCDGLNPQDVVTAAQQATANDFLKTIGEFPPCNDQYAVKHCQSQWPSCWMLTQIDPPPYNYRYYKPCDPSHGTAHAYCVYTCDVCSNSGPAYTFNCTWNQLGTPPCDDAPDPLSSWGIGNCYHIPCGSN